MATWQETAAPWLGSLTPEQQVFTKKVPWDTFWAPMRNWITGTAQSMYRPEFRQFQMNPYIDETKRQMRDMKFKHGLGGGFRTGQGMVDRKNLRKERALGGQQLRQGYGQQIQDVINQYRTSYAQPLYEQEMSRFESSPNRNFNPQRYTGSDSFRSGAMDFLEASSPYLQY